MVFVSTQQIEFEPLSEDALRIIFEIWAANQLYSYHFLRGRQTTDANGLVSFTCIFPGWYTSRATYIHVHIYKADGTSLLVTQIAFPEGTSSAVYNVNVNGFSYGYIKGMNDYTYNSTDNVFSDGVTSEMSTVTGSLSAGDVLRHTIYVNGATLGAEQTSKNKNFKVEQNFPNPFRDETVFPIILDEKSAVNIDVFEVTGRKVFNLITRQQLSFGRHEIKMHRNQLQSEMYFAKVTVENSKGKFEENLKIIVN